MAPNHALPVWGNEKTMNLNTLILTNIQSSPYFKVNLFELKTYHEVIDEIYYKVSHLEPWEKGSRKTAGQTGMCGGVRGVGAGGIVSSAYCLLYKLYTLKLTKKQLIGLITHADSPYIRGLGFMYIRYTQPPPDLWEWYEEYLDDEEEIDVKAGGGHVITIGELCRQFLVKLEWYSTLFPRIPVPVQKSLQEKIKANPPIRPAALQEEEEEERPPRSEEVSFGEAERMASQRSPPRRRSRSPRRSPQRRSPLRRSSPRRSPPARRRSPRRSKSPRNSRSPRRSPSRYDKERGRDHNLRRGATSNDDFARELEREKDRQRREKEKSHRPEKTRDRKKERRSRSRERRRSHSRERKGEKSDRHKSRSAEEHKDRKRSRSREQKASRSKEHKRSKSHEHKRDGKKSKDRGQDRHNRMHEEHNRDLERNSSPRRKNNENGDS